MRAVRIHSYGGPEVLVRSTRSNVPSRARSRYSSACVAASVNPIDVSVREDRFPTPKQPPKTLGSDGAGVVVAVGPEATGRDGRRRGAVHRARRRQRGQLRRLRPDRRHAWPCPRPPSLSFPEAAALGLAFATAYYALVRRAALQPGETVLVQGAAGGVGSASVQLAKALGATRHRHGRRRGRRRLRARARCRRDDRLQDRGRRGARPRADRRSRRRRRPRTARQRQPRGRPRRDRPRRPHRRHRAGTATRGRGPDRPGARRRRDTPVHEHEQRRPGRRGRHPRARWERWSRTGR